MTDDAERIIDLYERHADTWDRERHPNSMTPAPSHDEAGASLRLER
jgi:hypothetical protein